MDDQLISLVPPFICSNSPSRRPSDILQTLLISLISSIHLLQTHQIDDPLISTVPPFICSNMFTPSRRPSDIHCSSIHLLKLSSSPKQIDVPLVSLRPSDITCFLHSFAQTHQVDVPPFMLKLSLVPPHSFKLTKWTTFSDHCSSVHFAPISIHLLKLKRPSDILVPPFICSNSPSRRPSDIPLFLHSFAQTHQVDDPLISLVPPFICSKLTK
ncbi:unnamed protein product [Acanthosepion pharaonis]|uniref:Uncharacterized protein n=1 Tax=Acanthosepion pharaonis TaxID=158019 RepID=A0A812B7C0_ACAPH|nr:unnamed protein product [Sepia pharaonis]